MIDYFKAHRYVLWQFVKRQVLEQYKGSFIGIGWVFIAPILMLLVLTLVFNGIFKLKWPGTESLGTMGFALHVFIGMLIFNFFAELTGKSPSLILSHSNLVTKIVFPLPIIAVASVLSAAVNLLVMLFVLILFTAWIHTLNFAILQLPFILLALMIFMLGLTLLFSALGVFFRDLKQINTLLASLLMFLSPVFYPVTSIPEAFRGLYMSNPLAQFMEMTRTVLVDGQWISLFDMSKIWLISLLTLFLGWWVFSKLKKGFADVL
ncbi:MAG: ABC transporter permease [Thiomicrorhabdus sp.]|nr:ABC transporter permease [Thiomicrorhabdus sp.]